MTITAPSTATSGGAAPRRSLRTESLEARPVNLDGFVEEWPEKGMVAMDSAFDPAPSIRVEDGVITEMDGTERADFDFIDQFIADHAIDTEAAVDAMALDTVEIARMIVDPGVTRTTVRDVVAGLTPAKLLGVANHLNIVEIMMGMQKMRARRTPANQAHCTSARDNPLQVACEAAEAALRGFSEIETTLGVVRYAPLVAMAQTIGGPGGRRGAADAVRPGGGHRARARHARDHELRRDDLGLRHRAGLRRRRRHAVVEGVPGLGLRLARHQDALHLGHRLRGPDGQRAGQVDALPGDPLHPDREGRRRPRASRTARSPASGCPGRCPPGSARWRRRT